jgi:hypothetical protein
LGCILFLGLRLQRLDYPSEPTADEGVYLHVARHLHDSGALLSSWHFIPRGGIYPTHPPPYHQSIVQPGLPALLAPFMEGNPHHAGRRLLFLLGGLSLACSVIALWRIGGPWAAAGCALFSGLSFSQLEYGTLIHTETPMTLVVYASLATLVVLLPTHPLIAAASAGAWAGLGLYFRTNGVFFPLALVICLFIRRREFPKTWIAGLAASLAVMGPQLLYSTLCLGSPLASDSGDILWASSLEDFRSAHAAPLNLFHLVSENGWLEVLGRPFTGGMALAARLIEADHGRTVPLLVLGAIGFWRSRKHIALQALLLGTLPTLAVTIWVSPVSWCDRYIHFLMPALYGMAGYALASLAALFGNAGTMGNMGKRRLIGSMRLAGLARWAAPLGITVIALAFLGPHRYYQRAMASSLASNRASMRAPTMEPFIAPHPTATKTSPNETRAVGEAVHAALQSHLDLETSIYLVGTAFSRFNWRRPYPGANLPALTPVDSIAPVLKRIFGSQPSHLILSGPEEEGLKRHEKDWLENRLVFREEGFAVFRLSPDSVERASPRFR